MKFPFQRLVIPSILLGMFMAVVSCGGEQATVESEHIVDQDVEKPKDEKAEAAQKILYMIPSPVQTASMLQKAGSEYNADYLNDIAKVASYETVFKEAINLGIYSADLSYTSIFEQTQETMLYSKVVKRMADKLGVMNAFDDDIMARLEANVDNRDSMVSIVSDSYYVIDSYLKESGREQVSALILAGGWLEGFYITSRIVEDMPDNEEIKRCVADQKYSLNHLYNLVGAYPNDESLSIVLKDLNKLKKIYDQLEVASETAVTAETQENGVAKIGGGQKLVITPGQMAALSKVVFEIRNSYVE